MQEKATVEAPKQKEVPHMKNRKWMQKLNRFAMSSVAAFALMVVGGIANRSCYWYFGQDELPEGAKKLRRF